MKSLLTLFSILFLQSCSSEGGQFNRGYVISKTQWEQTAEEEDSALEEKEENPPSSNTP